jgi:CAAX prenyl protease-like protein
MSGSSATSRRWWIDEVAYVAPMAVFLAFTWAGVKWKEISWVYPATYVAKTVLTGILLIVFWRYYTKIKWSYWWLGIIVGVIGIVQWVGMQLWLQNHFAWFKPGPHPFDAFEHFHSREAAWAFVGVRIFGAVIVVPVMEELFWRDYLWRQILAPNDFKLAEVGEFDWVPFLLVPCFFSMVHGNWWPTAIVWALMVGTLLVYTKSLGACIVAHAVTNLLLAVYVLKTGDWAFW